MATNIGDLKTGGFDTQSCRVLHHVTRSMLLYPLATSCMHCQPNQRVNSRYEDIVKTMAETICLLYVCRFGVLHFYVTILSGPALAGRTANTNSIYFSTSIAHDIA